MEFRLNQDLRDFRQEVHDYLVRELPPWWVDQYIDQQEVSEFGQEFARKLVQKGWLAIQWPKEYGGSGASHWEWAVFREEMFAHNAPWGGRHGDINFLGPAIMRFGTEEQKRQHLPRIARAEVLWCESYSEPNVGHDIASIQTRADEDGDEFVINGQKVWTSNGHLADWCLLLARTDPNADRPYRGLSFFLVDMQTSGITARQIPNVIWEPFSEVIFDNVRVPANSLLGEKNRGFYQAMSALADERLAENRYSQARGYLERLILYMNTTRRNGRLLAEDPVLRRKLAQIAIHHQVARRLNHSLIAQLDQGEDVMGVELNVARVWDMLLQQRLQDLAMEALGPLGRLEPGCPWAPLGGGPAAAQGKAWHSTVSPGSIEIQKMIIATRGLGLPRDR